MTTLDRTGTALFWALLAATPLVVVQLGRAAPFDAVAGLFATVVFWKKLRRPGPAGTLTPGAPWAFGALAALALLYAAWSGLYAFWGETRFLPDSLSPALLAVTAAALALHLSESPGAPGAASIARALRCGLAAVFCAQFALFALYFLLPEGFFLRFVYFAVNLHDPVYKLSFPFRFSNQCSGFLALGLPLYLALVLGMTTRRFLPWGIVAGFGFLATLHTASRSAVGGVAFGTALALAGALAIAIRERARIPGGLRRVLVRCALVLAAAGGALALGANLCITPADDLSPCRRALSVFSMFAEGGYEEFRTENTHAAFAGLGGGGAAAPRAHGAAPGGLPASPAARLLLGAGPGKTVLLTPDGHEIHNTYAALFAEVGILGLLFFAAALLACGKAMFSELRKSRDPEVRRLIWALGVGLLSFAVAAGAHQYVKQRHAWVALGLALGVALAQRGAARARGISSCAE